MVFAHTHSLQGFNDSPVPSRQPVVPYLLLQSNLCLPPQVPSAIIKLSCILFTDPDPLCMFSPLPRIHSPLLPTLLHSTFSSKHS